ncbi:hypothetical protein GCM10008904_21320 [Paraclostridium ghonii]|uniref:Amino acid adenylation domain-containing protein n=1 Tax=Paraclostridium ghonii TaxID=29358 RepID=A0ABU0N0L6_9FIRM|nr:non-ribosomal peptide synthetase [Paeniclostridium ghonii]MDQ0556524.1 amino acid adenylation domain-containing protein [Paeniclostridium ghonii]
MKENVVIKTKEINENILCLPENLVMEINHLCNNSLYGIYTIIVSAVYYAIYGYRQEKDFIIAVPKTEGENNITEIGFLKVKINNNLSYKEYLVKIKEELYEISKPFKMDMNDTNNSIIPYEKKCECLVTLNNIHNDVEEYYPNYNIVFKSNISLKKLEIKAVYDCKVYSEKYINNIMSVLNATLNNISKDVNITFKELNAKVNPLRFMLYNDLNSTYMDFTNKNIIHNIFEKISSKNPNQIALICNNESITYKELNKRSNVLANKLRSYGVKKNTLVGIMTSRSLELFISILAVLKSGGAYVPIDNNYPLERVNYILNDSEIKILLVDNNEFNQSDSMEIINVAEESNYLGFNEEIININEPEDLAYVIYTSGSTGNPKGVMIQHKAAVNFIYGINSVIQLSTNVKILNITTVSFDIFGYESLAPLLFGATVVIADEEKQNDIKKVKALIKEFSIDVLQTTPSRMGIILEDDNNNDSLRSLKHIVIGGEIFQDKILDKITEFTDAKVYNFYGPTEATIWSTYKELNLNENINIGKPLPNYEIYVLRDDNNLADIGSYGEICISGAGLAKGYLKNSKLTQEKFVEFVDNNGIRKRLYKTADIGRVSYNCEIECIGRKDDQIKLRGYRIELGEIESVCLKCEQINEVSVICVKSENQGDILVAYYTANQKLELKYIRDFMGKYLPKYMIPQYYIKIDNMPLNSNGKIDKNELRKIDFKYSANEIIKQEKTSETERAILQIWKQVLNTEYVNIEDNFFDIGGNSLLLLKVHSKIDELYRNKISVIQIFDSPTIKDIAKFLREDKNLIGIDMKEITFPYEYFQIKDSDNYAMLKYEISQKSLEKLSTLKYKLNIKINDILAGMFNYCCHEITNENSITVHYLMDDKRSRMLSIDYVDIEKIEQLFEIISYKIKRDSEEETYNIKIIESIYNSETNKIIPLYYVGDVDYYDELCTVYDLILNAKINEENTILVLNFNDERLSKNKVLEFFNIYINLIEILINNINE